MHVKGGINRCEAEVLVEIRTSASPGQAGVGLSTNQLLPPLHQARALNCSSLNTDLHAYQEQSYRRTRATVCFRVS